MKAQALRRFAFAVLAITVATAVSQTKPGDTIINVPFRFMVANHELPPGRYVVTDLAGDLRLIDHNNQTALAPTHAVAGKAPDGVGKMVFHKYGDTYFLYEVWSAGNSTGKQLFPSNAEREMAKALGVGQAKPEVAELKAEH